MDRPKEFPPVPYRDLLPTGTRVRVTKPTDGAGRWKHGDIGVLVENDFAKYDYCVRFLDAACPVVYFFGGEIEPVEGEPAIKIPKVRVKVIPPPCLSCGRPLRRYRFRKEARLRDAAKARETAKTAPRPNYWLKIADDEELKAFAMSVDREQWGDYGDDAFCGINCGYRWALQQICNVRAHGNWTLPSLEKMREGVRR